MRYLAALLAVALLCASSAAVAAPAPEEPVADGVLIEIGVTQSGDARWNVSTRYPLRTANDTAAFADLQAAVEDGEAGFTADVYRHLAADAATRTGRSMAITEVSRAAFVTETGNATYGVVSLSFTWTNFGATTEEGIVVGDAFDAWELGPDQSLVVSPPQPDGSFDSVSPAVEIRDGVARWDGPRSFEAGRPRLSVDTRVPPGTSTTGTGGSGPDTTPPATNEGLDLGPGTAFAVLIAGGLAAYVFARRDALFGEGAGGQSTTDGGEGPASTAGGAAAEAAAGGPEDADAADDDIDPELLSDEERVERLLTENGGRMKQANIVKETGWSNAKVSQLLSGMDEDGQIEKLRLGRENLISLPDEGEE